MQVCILTPNLPGPSFISLIWALPIAARSCSVLPASCHGHRAVKETSRTLKRGLPFVISAQPQVYALLHGHIHVLCAYTMRHTRWHTHKQKHQRHLETCSMHHHTHGCFTSSYTCKPHPQACILSNVEPQLSLWAILDWLKIVAPRLLHQADTFQYGKH